jgi:hypothetical protein
MKNTYALAFVLFFALFHAQSFAQSFFGARVGVNLAKFGYQFESNDDEKEARDATSFHPVVQGGVFFRKQINHFAFQPELCWVQKGVRLENNFSGITETNFITVNYLEAPLLLKGVFGSDSKMLSVFAGPAFSYAIAGHSKIEETINGSHTSDKVKIDFKDDQYYRFEVSAQVGIGGSFKAGKGFIEADVRYMYGLTKLNSDGGTDKYFNRGIAVSLGYILPFH